MIRNELLILKKYNLPSRQLSKKSSSVSQSSLFSSPKFIIISCTSSIMLSFLHIVSSIHIVCSIRFFVSTTDLLLRYHTPLYAPPKFCKQNSFQLRKWKLLSVPAIHFFLLDNQPKLCNKYSKLIFSNPC